MKSLEWKMSIEDVFFWHTALGDLSPEHQQFQFWEKLDEQLRMFLPKLPEVPLNLNVKEIRLWEFSYEELTKCYTFSLKLPTKTKAYKALLALESQILKYSKEFEQQQYEQAQVAAKEPANNKPVAIKSPKSENKKALLEVAAE
jgi:hypothetical protein